MADSGFHIDIEPPRDSTAERNREWRWLVLAITIVLVWFGPAYIGAFAGSLSPMAPVTQPLGLMAGWIIGTVLFSRIVHRLVVYNPEWQAYVTIDVISGEMIPYGPGLHPALPWEERNKSNNYSLEIITKQFAVMVQTTTAQVTATGAFQYAIDLNRITSFVGVDASTIEDGFTALIESFLTREFAEKSVEEARSSVGDVNELLAQAFMHGLKTEAADDNPVNFEYKYGIKTVSVVIQGLQLPEAAQKSRDAIDEAIAIRTVVARLYGLSLEDLDAQMKSGTLKKEDYDKMLNRALSISENGEFKANVLELDLPAGIIEGLQQFFGNSKFSVGGGNSARPN